MWFAARVKRIPAWAWLIAFAGLAAVVGGAFADGYSQAVLLQLGTVALLLIPILLVERTISLRLRQTLDDRELIRRADAILDMDDMWRDFGQKLAGKLNHSFRMEEVESWMHESGWTKYRTFEDHTLWSHASRRLALPVPKDGMLPSPHVRLVVRRLGWTEDELDSRLGVK